MVEAGPNSRRADESNEAIPRRVIIAKAVEATRAVRVDRDTHLEIRRLITESLFVQAPAYLAVEAIAAAMTAGVHAYFQSTPYVWVWLFLCCAGLIVRWVHVQRYFSKMRSPEETIRWARVFAAGTLLSGFLWGISGPLFFSAENMFLLIVQIFMVTGLGAMALTSYSAHAPSFYLFLVPAILPFGIRLAAEGTAVLTFVAILLSIWLAVFVYLCHLLSSRYFERTLFLTRAELGAATRRATDLADQANQAKTRFLANVSHELRTPLNAIIGFSEMLRSGYFGKLGHVKYAEYVDDINRSGHHLKKLIDDVLDISRIEMGRMKLNTERVPVSTLMHECASTTRTQFEQACVLLTVACAKALPFILGDGLRLKQIILNLLTNAIKFTPPGGSVSLTAGLADDGDLMIHVSDTGIGMKHEDIPRALLPFVQLANSPFQGDHGLGIGLHLVRVFAEAHEGSVMIHSEPGRGSIITVRLPKRRLVGASQDEKSPAISGSLAAAA